MKRFLSFCIMLAVFLCVSTALAAVVLPEIAGWECGELRTTALDTVSGNKGQWLERDYRTQAGTPFHAVWIDGAGQKGWNTPKSVSNDDGTGALYRTIDVSGNSAVLERHPITGPSLTVKVARLGVLTLESNNATTDEELLDAAIVIIEKLR